MQIQQILWLHGDIDQNFGSTSAQTEHVCEISIEVAEGRPPGPPDDFPPLFPVLKVTFDGEALIVK